MCSARQAYKRKVFFPPFAKTHSDVANSRLGSLFFLVALRAAFFFFGLLRLVSPSFVPLFCCVLTLLVLLSLLFSFRQFSFFFCSSRCTRAHSLTPSHPFARWTPTHRKSNVENNSRSGPGKKERTLHAHVRKRPHGVARASS